MSACCFWVGGNPVTKGSWKVSRHGKLRPDSEKERPWAHAIGWSAKAAGAQMLNGPVRLIVYFSFVKPKRPSNAFPARMDVDKLARCAMDALTGIAYRDDQQVIELISRKAWADERGPGVEVQIVEAA